MSDGLGGADQESRAITINGVNSAPVMTVDPQAGGVYEITVVDDDGDSVTLTRQTNVLLKQSASHAKIQIVSRWNKSEPSKAPLTPCPALTGTMRISHGPGYA